MEQLILKGSIGLFVIAFALGLYILYEMLTKRKTSKLISLCHVAVAGVGIGIVFYYVLNNLPNAPVISLILFLLTAAGGLTLFGLDHRNKKLANLFAIGHPLIGVLSLLALIYFVVKS